MSVLFKCNKFFLPEQVQQGLKSDPLEIIKHETASKYLQLQKQKVELNC